jgi:hypothetical protein
VPLEEWKKADPSHLDKKVKIRDPHKIDEISSSENDLKNGSSFNSE